MIASTCPACETAVMPSESVRCNQCKRASHEACVVGERRKYCMSCLLAEPKTLNKAWALAQKFFEDFSDTREEWIACLVFAAGLIVGTYRDHVRGLLRGSVLMREVDPVINNLEANGIWANGHTCLDEAADEAEQRIAILLAIMCGAGLVRRETDATPRLRIALDPPAEPAAQPASTSAATQESDDGGTEATTAAAMPWQKIGL